MPGKRGYKRKRPASRKYRKPAKRAYKKRVSYRKKATRGPRNTVALLKNPDLKPNRKVVRVVFQRTIQVGNYRGRGIGTPVVVPRYPAAQFMSVNLNSPWIYADDQFTVGPYPGEPNNANFWEASSQVPMVAHTQSASVRSGTSYPWLFGQGGDTAGPNTQIPGIAPGEQYGQMFVTRNRVSIRFKPATFDATDSVVAQRIQPTTLFGVIVDKSNGRCFTRVYNGTTGETNVKLIDRTTTLPDLKGTPNKKYCAVESTVQVSKSASNLTSSVSTKTPVSLANPTAHGGELYFDYRPSKFNLVKDLVDKKEFAAQIFPNSQNSPSGASFNVPTGQQVPELDTLTFGIMPTYGTSTRADNNIYDGNLCSGYLQLRMEATILMGEPFTIRADMPQ